jgi:hypothetical protein
VFISSCHSTPIRRSETSASEAGHNWPAQPIEAAAQRNFISIFFGAGNALTMRNRTSTEFGDGHPRIVRVVEKSGYATLWPTSTWDRAASTANLRDRILDLLLMTDPSALLAFPAFFSNYCQIMG